MTEIGEKVFYGCKNLKSIVIKSTKLTKQSVGTKTFKGVHSKVTVTVPQSKHTEYEKMLRARGIPDAYILEWKVVDKEESTGGESTKDKNSVVEDGVAVKNYVAGQPLLEPQNKSFSIGDCLKYNRFDDDSPLVSGYFPNRNIQFTAGIKLPVEIYGNWEKKISASGYFQCGTYRRNFNTNEMPGLHCALTECGTGNYYMYPGSVIFKEWIFAPDSSPCKVVYRFTLPDGLSYKEWSVKVTAWNAEAPSASDYKVEYAGNTLTVTIEDAKSLPYYAPFDREKYDKNPYAYETVQENGKLIVGRSVPINVLFSTNLNENATVTGTVTYSYKGMEKTVDLGGRTVRLPKLESKD